MRTHHPTISSQVTTHTHTLKSPNKKMLTPFSNLKSEPFKGVSVCACLKTINMMYRFITVSFALLLTMVGTAQFDSTQVKDSPEPSISYKAAKFKPRLGLGMGTLTYFGELGKDNRGYNPATTNMAYKISLSSDITSYFGAEVYSLFGQITINDYNSENRMNFKSEIRSGGVAIKYNFGNFINPEVRIKPVISVGFESVEFLSKVDLMDREGNYYHYWSDGTIRDIAEDQENAGNANFISQDYIYETDLRDMDLDGLGNYNDRAWSIPIGLSAQWQLTDRFRVQIGTQLHLTSSDLIDNVSSRGKGARQGDDLNDRLLFSSVAASYDLNITARNKISGQTLPMEDENGEMMMVMIDEDGDFDGVNDFVDKCLGTPEGIEVDKNGCAIDTDKDGVPDHEDEENWTVSGAPVNTEGITITDEEFLEEYLIWIDSIPFPKQEMIEDYAKLESDMFHWTNTYSVKVSPDQAGMTQSEINLLLSYKDIKSMNENGEEVYLVGQYNDLPDAVARKINLQENGIHGGVTKEEDGELIDYSAEAADIEAAIDEYSALPSNDGSIFRVQLGAYRYQLSENIFAGIEGIIALRGEDGLTRYMSQGYDNALDAAARKIDLLRQGFEGAFVTAYSDGDRITLAEAGMGVLDEKTDITHDVENKSIDPELITYRIQLGAFLSDIPTETLDHYLAIGNVKPIKSEDGMIKYLTGQKNNYSDAKQYLDLVRAQGIPNAFVVGEFNGAIIPAEEARMIKEE